jgi:hypothetical protein
MYIHFFRFVVDIYVGFAPASSNLASPSYDSPRSTRECTDLLRTFHAFCHYTPVFSNILLAEEVGQCSLASLRRGIVVNRAGVLPLQDKIFSHLLDLTILNSFIVSSENVISLRIMMEHVARGGTSALSTTISRLEEACGHWLTSSANRILSHVPHTWEEPEYNDKMHEKYRVGLGILGCFVACRKKASYPVSQRHIA